MTKVTKPKTVKIIVRATPETKRRFRILMARGGFRNYEEFLAWLLERAESEWLQGWIY